MKLKIENRKSKIENAVNRPGLLHIIERLEGFLHKLPETIQRPVLHELTPLKELFLQQRPPRFVLSGSNQLPLQEVVATLFGGEQPPAESRDVLMELFRWHAMDLSGRGAVSFLDARGAEARTIPKIREELEEHPADILIHLANEGEGVREVQSELENVATFLRSASAAATKPKVVGVVLRNAKSARHDFHLEENRLAANAKTKELLQTALQEQPGIAEHLLQVVEIASGESGASSASQTQSFLSLLARGMPNQARVEMARLAGDRGVQGEIAQSLVKSTTAICAAIGAQPIPLADLPILTALQLVMVSGIMYISGRERSLRAATEFVGALGVNVGAGMLLREGTRALLKFFPGWGNVVCGAVAGAGTYAIGRASIGYFLEGITLNDARRTYLASRKKRARPETRRVKQIEAAH
ncbi:MAG TPA: hypothetical protein VJU77_15970 [Chthoniobacterales bacterium]|nr:hypothetical protein [Chthoniobacterales bacterium]